MCSTSKNANYGDTGLITDRSKFTICCIWIFTHNLRRSAYAKKWEAEASNLSQTVAACMPRKDLGPESCRRLSYDTLRQASRRTAYAKK